MILRYDRVSHFCLAIFNSQIHTIHYSQYSSHLTYGYRTDSCCFHCLFRGIFCIWRPIFDVLIIDVFLKKKQRSHIKKAQWDKLHLKADGNFNISFWVSFTHHQSIIYFRFAQLCPRLHMCSYFEARSFFLIVMFFLTKYKDTFVYAWCGSVRSYRIRIIHCIVLFGLLHIESTVLICAWYAPPCCFCLFSKYFALSVIRIIILWVAI